MLVHNATSSTLKKKSGKEENQLPHKARLVTERDERTDPGA